MCSGWFKNLNNYKGTTPIVDIKDYFNGPVKAWGILQDYRGRVTRRFDILLAGTWQGDIGTLTETFFFDDGEKKERVWSIKKLPGGSYEGTASDIINKATGKSIGCAVRWNYVMDLPVGNTTYHIRFDDWMWAINDDVLINRSYLKKFGFTVAELSIFMQKQKP